ncbi:hypothetical protein EV177_003693 [Coemansia sp. RSA 1804]|nr:hypothetical protein EV177_003693 [Coemansia sp. RSA 1804]
MPDNDNIGSTSAVYNDVTRDNIAPLFKDIRDIISRAKFVAIDTEFTGLVLSNASRLFRFNTAEWVTRATDMKEKYKAMANIARTHALLSLGVSVYSRRHVSVPGSFNVNNFNFTLQAQNSHLINPSSVSFLARNGFDLTRQAAKGIRFFSSPNPDPVVVKTEEINEEGRMIREIFLDLVRLRKPLVIHNGLFDLVYLYQSFFGPLPDTYESFVYDLHEMFPGGIYDTKVIVEGADPTTASFLAYAYHKSERIQKRRALADEPALDIRLRNRLKDESPKPSEPQPAGASSKSGTQRYCSDFAVRGHCKLDQKCPLSHDINFILDCQEREEGATGDSAIGTSGATIPNKPASVAKRKRDSDDPSEGKPKRKASESALDVTGVSSVLSSTVLENGVGNDGVLSSEKQAVSDADTNTSNDADDTDSTDDTDDTSTSSEGIDAPALNPGIEAMYHTAAYDAFMTGYVFASCQMLLPEKLGQYKNKVYLMGRSGTPLLIKASMYATNSITYRQTMDRVVKAEKKVLNGPETSTSETKPLPGAATSDQN